MKTPAVLVGQAVGDSLGMPFEELEKCPPQLTDVAGSLDGSGLAKTRHCEDSRCELPRDHDGVHRMGLYIRISKS